MAAPARVTARALAATFVALAVFIVLSTIATSRPHVQELETLRRAAHYTESARITTIAITHVGDSFPLFVVTMGAILVLVSRGQRLEARFVGLAMFGTWLLTTVLKLSFSRARPDLHGVPLPPSAAFPSGHAAGTMTAALAAWFVVRSLAPAKAFPVLMGGLATATLVGVSRVALGVHWPSDVLGGWALAVAWTLAARMIVFREKPADS